MTPEREERFKKVIKSRQPNLTIILENVHDPHNISAVLRTCDSVGITEVFVLYTKVKKENLELGKRSSSGARKWVDVHLYNDVDKCMQAVKAKYDKIFATHLSEDAVDLYGIERFIGELIPRATEAGFEPSNPVPERELDARPIKPKKPKKAKQPFSKPKSDSKKPNSNGSGIGPRRGGSGNKSNAKKYEYPFCEFN